MSEVFNQELQINQVSRSISTEQVKALQALSRQAASQLDLRFNLATLSKTIAERAQVEKSLQKVAAKNLPIAQALAAASDGVLITDPNQLDNPIIYANPAFCRITGYNLEEIMGHNCRFLQGPRTDPQAIAQIRQAIAERREVRATLLNYRQDGQPFWNELKISPVFSSDGDLLYFVGIQTDITERKQLEEQLRRREQELTDFFANAAIGLQWVGADGKILWANQAELDLLGYTREDYIGHSITKFHADPEVIADILQRLSQKETLRNYEARLRCKDGSIKYVLINSNVFYEDGKFIHIRCFTQDISDRKQAEEKQRDSEQKLKLAMQAARFGFWQLNLATGELSASNQCKANFGLPPEAELSYSKLFECIHPDDRSYVQQSVSRALEQQTIYEAEYRNIWPDNTVHWVLARGSGIYEANGTSTRMIGVTLDITERKHQEEALRQSENRLRTIIDAEPECVKLVAADGSLLEMNAAGLAMIEAESAEAVIGHSVYSLIAPEYREAFQALNESVCQGNKDTLEFEIIGCQGNRRWLETHAVPLRNKLDGKLVQLAITRDITERKQAEEALHDSEKRLRAILEHSPAAVYLKDLQGRYILINRKYEILMHMQAEQAISKTDYEILPHEIAKALRDNDQTMIETGTTLEFEEVLPQKDGLHTFISLKFPLYDSVGVPYAICGISTDITERKQAEEQIRAQATLLDKSQDAIFVLDLEDRIHFWNESAKRLYGWTASEAIARRVDKLLFAKDLSQLQEAQKGVAESGEWQGELQQITKDGKEIIVESRWTLVRHDTEKPKSILVVNTDITEKKQLEKQFFRAQRLESIGTLAGGIAHDLNNILTPILAASQLLQRKLPGIDEQSQQLLTTLESNTRRGAALVRQVLSFGRGVEGQRTILQVKHIISEIKQIATQTFPKSIELYVDAASDLWPVSGDVTQLHQVLMNLCVNARDAMPDGGTLSISAENLFVDQNYARLHLEAKVGPYIVATVEDSGVGIPPEIIDRVFEPFFTTKAVGKGTGLGLATVIGIIKSHGGFISVSSKVSKGTQFKVFLPAVEATEILSVEDPELPIGNGELILVVDDEAPIRETTQISLDAHNYKVLTASDGIEAIALYSQRNHEISVVLVDMMMPSMDGVSTIQALQKLNPQVKIIAMSGLSATDTLTEQTGIKTFLSKPYNAQELLQTLHNMLVKV